MSDIALRNRGPKATMAHVSWASIVSHKLRLTLTILAVVLGTAFISGSFMFTASLGKVFEEAVANQLEDVDAVASSELGFIAYEDVEKLKEHPHVASVANNDAANVVVAKGEREPIQTRAGGASVREWPSSPVGDGPELVRGDLPEKNDQVVVNEQAVEKYGLDVGQEILVVDPQSRHNMKIVGVFQLEEAGASSIDLRVSEQTFREVFAQGEGYSSLLVSGKDLHDRELIDALSKDFPGIKFDSGKELAKDITEQVRKGLSFINYFLVAFGAIALLVGTFIIANTFAMIVAQRNKEFALMRAIGISTRQLTASVVLEALFVGLIGSGVGVLAGAGLVAVIQKVMARFDMPLDDAGIGLNAQSILIPLALGTAVTVLSAWAPARRAGRVRPVEAMRTTETATESSLKVRTIIGLVAMAAAVAIAAVAVQSDGSTKSRAIQVGVAALFLIVGFFLASPALSIPIVGTLGRILGAPLGAVGKLAWTNSRRNPKRTATTAFALTLGVALVAAISMLSETMKASIEDLVTSEVKAEYVLTGAGDNSFPIPAGVEKDVREVSGVESVTAVAWATVDVDGASAPAMPGMPVMTFVSSGKIDDTRKLQEPEGSFDLREPNVMIADRKVAEEHGWKIGDTLPVRSPEGQPVAEAKLIGTYVDSNSVGPMQLSAATLDGTPFEAHKITVQLLVKTSEISEEMQKRLDDAVAEYLVVRVMSTDEFAGEQAGTVNQLLYILYALLGLSVVIAILGIINTLALNVIERRQEIGMLRAVGTQRSQIRKMITVESLQVAFYGAISGIVIGLGLGWAFVEVLSTQGLGEVSIPWLEIIWIMIGSAVVGVIAALWPAFKAAKTPPLEAIAD